MSAFHVGGALSKPSSFSARFGLTTKFLVYFHCQHTSIPPFQPSFSHYQLKALFRKFYSSDETSLFLLTSSLSPSSCSTSSDPSTPFPRHTPQSLRNCTPENPSPLRLQALNTPHPIRLPKHRPLLPLSFPFLSPPPPRPYPNPYPAPPTLSTSTPRSYNSADSSTGTSVGQQAVISAVRASGRRAFRLLRPWVLLSGDGDRDRGV